MQVEGDDVTPWTRRSGQSDSHRRSPAVKHRNKHRNNNHCPELDFVVRVQTDQDDTVYLVVRPQSSICIYCGSDTPVYFHIISRLDSESLCADCTGLGSSFASLQLLLPCFFYQYFLFLPSVLVGLCLAFKAQRYLCFIFRACLFSKQHHPLGIRSRSLDSRINNSATATYRYRWTCNDIHLWTCGLCGNGTQWGYHRTCHLESKYVGFQLFVQLLSTYWWLVSRTIVASASGWFEPFSVNTIQCHFVDATFGECFDTSATASGAPTPHGFALASPTPVTTSSSTGISESTFTSSPSAPSAPTTKVVSPTTTSVSDVSQSSRTSSVGAIVGGSIAGIAGLLALGVIFWLFRRKRVQKVAGPEKLISGQPNRGILQAELDPLSPNVSVIHLPNPYIC